MGVMKVTQQLDIASKTHLLSNIRLGTNLPEQHQKLFVWKQEFHPLDKMRLDVMLMLGSIKATHQAAR